MSINFIKERITALKQLAVEHEEYLPEEERFTRYKLDLDTLRDEETDEAQAAIFNSNLHTEIDVSRELVFHSRKLFETLDINSTKVDLIGLEQDEIKLLKVLELIIKADSISKLIDDFRKDSLDELPTFIDDQLLEANKKLVSNIELIFSDNSDKQLVLDSMKELDNEMAFFMLTGFYQSQVLKLLKGMPLVI